MSAPSMRIDAVDFYMRNVRTRMPFQYGVAILTSVPILHVVVNATVEGKRTRGVAADILPPKWFDKDPEKAFSMPDNLLSRLSGLEQVEAVAPRVETPATISSTRRADPVTLVGVDPLNERQVTFLHSSIQDGSYI